MREVRIEREDVELLCGLLRSARSDAIKVVGEVPSFLRQMREGAAADRDRFERLAELLGGAHSIVARVVEGQG
jgi:hypothetical protein